MAASNLDRFRLALASATLVLYTHRGNVRRMREGVEPRARKLWLFGRGRQ